MESVEGATSDGQEVSSPGCACDVDSSYFRERVGRARGMLQNLFRRKVLER
jgi:hypothetical protein